MFVDVSNIVKKYPGTTALDSVSFGVEKGTVLGVLGENGAGKSTLLRIIASITRPSGGSVTVDGVPVGLDTRSRVAFLPEVNPFYRWMKVTEQLEFLASFYPGWDMAKSRELLDFFDLPPKAAIGTLSRGQVGKLKIVYAFSWPAALVLMDEPLGGIDPPSRKKIIAGFLGEFRFDEQTIILSTHLVDEVEELIEHVIYLKNGRLVLAGQADRLREEHHSSLAGMFGEIAS